MQRRDNTEKAGDAWKPTTPMPSMLTKQGDGSSYAPWLRNMKSTVLDLNNTGVAAYGSQILTDQEAFMRPLNERLEAVEGEEKRSMIKVRENFIAATHSVFNYLERYISQELRELVQADEGYVQELRVVNIWEPRPVHVLLSLLKKHVSSDVSADETFHTLMALQGLHAIKQEDDESTRAYADRIKAALVRFETVSPYGRVFQIPDVQFTRTNLASPEDRLATRATSSRDSPHHTATVLLKSEDIRDVVTPENGWMTKGYVVRIAIMNMCARNEALRTEWMKRLTDGKSGQEIPTDIENFVYHVGLRESMQGFITSQPGNQVNVTEKVSKKNGKRGRGADGDSKYKDVKCHHCGNKGHIVKDCRKKKREDANAAKTDKDKNKDAAKDAKKGGTPTPQADVMVTVGQNEDDDGGYVDPTDIFRSAFLTEGTVAEEVMVCASAVGDILDGFHFSSAAVRDEVILYDSCANLSIIRNPYLCHNVQTCSSGIRVRTLYGMKTKEFRLSGMLCIAGVSLRVYIDPLADNNVVSAADMEAACIAQGCIVTKPPRKSTSDRPVAAQVEDAQGRTLLQILYKGGLAKFTLDEIKQSLLTAYGQTLAAQDLERARMARELQRNLGHASHSAVTRMLSRKSITAGVKSKDLVLAKDALGPSVAELKGNFQRKKASIKRIPIPDAEGIIQQQQCYSDVFETMGIAFLIAVLEPMHLILTDQLANKTHVEIMRALRKVDGTVSTSGFTITEVHYDSDAKDTTLLAKFPNLIVHPPEQHVARAERGVRTIKECLRSFVQDRPWMPWWGRFAVQAVAAATAYIALRHGKNSKCMYSPFQQMTGRTPIAERDFKAGFGDLVMVENTRDDMKLNNVHRPRTLEAVWLRPNFDDHGSAKVLLLDSGEIVSRVVARVIGWEDHSKMVELLYKWSGAPKMDMTTNEVRFERHGDVQNLLTLTPDPGANVVWEEGVPIEEAASVLIGKTDNAVPMPTRFETSESGVHETRQAESNTQSIPPVTGDAEVTEVAVRGGKFIDYDVSNPNAVLSDQVYVESDGGGSSGNSVPPSRALSNQDDADPILHVSPSGTPETEVPGSGGASKGRKRKADSHEEIPNDDVEVVQAPLTPGGSHDKMKEHDAEASDNLVLDISQRGRTRRRSFKILSTEGTAIEEVVTTTIAKGLHQVFRLDGYERKKAVEAIYSEIKNLILDHDSLTGVHLADIDKEDVVLPTNLIVDDKAVNGKHVKFKARFIARGDLQKKADYAELSSQTVNTESVVILLAGAAAENRALAVIDVKGAYLNADMVTPGGRQTIVKIERDMANMFVKMKPELAEFVDDTGRLYMRVDKALYGCVQASALWQRTLTKALKGLGFVICDYDECVAMSADGTIILAFHVDDILVVGKRQEDVDAFKKKFETIFTVTYTVGNELDYLGMHISVQQDGIHMSQLPIVQKLVQDVGGTANSPACTNESEETLTAERRARDAVPLDVEHAALFRSKAASALYLAKRTRPDIMVAVNQLCRSAHSPTVGDNTALRRLLRYLSRTRNKHLLLPAGKGLQVEAHIDASFAPDQRDRKSTTGAVVFVGGAVVWAKSGKQTIVTKSSFEAELIALSDMASMVLWVNLFLRSLGFKADVPTIFQDNTSTMSVATNGLTNNTKTKHIDIRHLWIREVLADKQIRLVYKPTDEMLADGMTKPLIGAKFYAFVKGLNLL
jgi:hypothetical protein